MKLFRLGDDFLFCKTIDIDCLTKSELHFLRRLYISPEGPLRERLYVDLEGPLREPSVPLPAPWRTHPTDCVVCSVRERLYASGSIRP